MCACVHDVPLSHTSEACTAVLVFGLYSIIHACGLLLVLVLAVHPSL